MPRRTAVLWILSLPMQWLLVKYAKMHPGQIDRIYGLEWYPSLAEGKSIFSKIPFSFGDLLYAASILFLCYSLIKQLPKGWKGIKTLVSNGLAIGAILHLFFLISWGFNYYKTPLAQKLEVPLQYTKEELSNTLEYWIAQSNALHQQLETADSLPVAIPLDQKRIIGLLQSDETQPNYVKNSLWSLPLTYMGYAGYLNPFTGEAQVNCLLPTLSMITTIAHEMAHQKGFAPEQEANYWAFKNTTTHPNLYIRYAGATFALRYCYGALYRMDKEMAQKLQKNIRPGILRDFEIIADFWKKHQTPLMPYFENFYDQYLKSRGQEAGIVSYSLVVAFIIKETENQLLKPIENQ